MLHMMTSGARYGLRRTCFSMLGCFIAVSLMIGTSVAGVGALLRASPYLFDVLRYAGAGYLFYLGVQAWRSPVAMTIDAHSHADYRDTSPPLRLLRNGFFIGISNPKALLFAGAFFPQFIDTAAPQTPQLMLLFLTFALIETSCYTLYAIGGKQMAGMLKHSSFRRTFNRLTGTVFAAFGVMLVAKST